MPPTTRCVAAALAALLLSASGAASADAPAWFTDAAARAATAWPQAAAVVLVDDIDLVVGSDGRVTTTRRYAVRIQSADGEPAAAVREVVTADSGRVRTMRGWTLSGGRVTELGRGNIATLSLTENDVYNEARLHVLRAPAGIAPGTVFGAETVLSERSIFTQFEWVLQQAWPAMAVRRALTVPEGVGVTSTTFNHAPIAAVREGGAYRWTLQDVPAMADEPWSPPVDSLAPRLAVTYEAAGGALGPSFAAWDGVASWLASLGDPAASAAPPVTDRARALVAAASSEHDRLAALGAYVQRVQYISIQTGVGRGGGYRPHAASDVLARNYGDCKDKVALMRALLAGLGVRSRLVAVYAGDPDRVRVEWPSPQQFNHAIVAIAVSPAVEAPAIGTDADLGRVLYFDPTDEFTPLGELPLTLQGSWGLPAGARTALVRLPASGPDRHRSERRIAATIASNGALRATVTETSVGAAAAAARAMRQMLTRDEYARAIGAPLTRGIAGARVTPGDATDDPRTNTFTHTLTLETDRAVQPAGGHLLLVRVPAALDDATTPLGTNRRNPVRLEAMDRRDRLTLALPAGLAVDTLPSAAADEQPFGAWSVRWRQEGATAIRDVTMTVSRTTVPPAEASRVERFFVGLRRALEPPVVLRTTTP